MTRFILYPLAAIGAAATAMVATSLAVARQARRLDDDYLVGQLALLAAQPPALTDAYIDEMVRRIDLEQLWTVSR